MQPAPGLQEKSGHCAGLHHVWCFLHCLNLHDYVCKTVFLSTRQLAQVHHFNDCQVYLFINAMRLREARQLGSREL